MCPFLSAFFSLLDVGMYALCFHTHTHTHRWGTQFDTPVVAAALKAANGGVDFPVGPFRQGEIDSRSVFETFIRREWPCPTSA
jgi:hypothetical protein